MRLAYTEPDSVTRCWRGGGTVREEWKRMRRTLAGLTLSITLGVLPASVLPAAAQVAWDGPSLMAPGAPSGWGFHLLDAHPGGGLGVLFTWRESPAPVGIGFRFGLAEGGHDDLSLFGGLDVSGEVYSSTEEPVDVIWYTGGGVGVDRDVRLSVPAGMSVGWLLLLDDLALRPYAGLKVTLDAFLGDKIERGDDLHLGLSLELGADLAFITNWIIRVAVSIGDRDTLSIGVHLPGV